MFVLDWRLALISLSTIPLLIIATNIFKNKIKETFGDVRNQVSALNTFTQEHLTGMKIVQLFGREKKEYNRFEAINARHRDANIKSVWYYSIFFPVVEILSAISIGLIVWWGAGGVIRDDVTFGNLVAFIMYINMLFRPIRELADKFNTLQMGMVSSERIFKIMDEDEVTSDDGNLAPSSLKGDIEFKDVWFTYDKEESEKETTSWILKGISFKVKAGETIAFVGATGAGKSTIIGLLNRFYETNRGEILIDGVNIRSYRLTWLRQHIGIVLQDVFLFSDSIRNNLTLQNSAISDTELMAGAEVLGASALIKNLPGGLDFNVQERGNALSTGQRQLISFIRAYCYNPSVLVLDEATSSVDSETEELITAATRKLTQKSTSIVIAHRLATIQNADRIIVLEKGQIIETGNHTELIQQDGHYRHLFEIQFNGTGTEKINITN
jgi:ATP-binding cassette subfamily B protein